MKFLLALLFAPFVLFAATPDPLPDDPKCTDADREIMKRCYELADKAVKEGNSPFGAVLVVDGKIVGEGTNTVGVTRDPTRHAELGLISSVIPKLDHDTIRRSTLYASSEPCVMCCGAILSAGIPKIVYGVTEAQFQRIIGEHVNKDPLNSRAIMARTNKEVVILGPLMEKEGLVAHEAYWPEAMKSWSKKD
jgi:tRNA(Arg) A34 adenosine deaminase TadA